VVLVSIAFAPTGARSGERPPGPAQRLLGPISSLVASAQWVRVDHAFRAGRPELGFARAEWALALDPASPEGWSFLAWQQAFTLGSVEREPDPTRRLAWIRAGLETAARGEALSRDPASLARLQGEILLIKVATLDPDVGWPGGADALWKEAMEHFQRAHRLGDPMALVWMEAATKAAGAE
jgi:hypothetical protein